MNDLQIISNIILTVVFILVVIAALISLILSDYFSHIRSAKARKHYSKATYDDFLKQFDKFESNSREEDINISYTLSYRISNYSRSNYDVIATDEITFNKDGMILSLSDWFKAKKFIKEFINNKREKDNLWREK